MNRMSLAFYATSIAAILAIILSGCRLLSSDTVCESRECKAFEVHLNNNFNNDHVRVEIDRMVVFDERVTTNYVLSLAEVFRLERPAGMHQIKVTVGGERETRTFELDRKLFIHIRYYPKAIPNLGISKGVTIDISEHRPIYD